MTERPWRGGNADTGMKADRGEALMEERRKEGRRGRKFCPHAWQRAEGRIMMDESSAVEVE